MMKDLIKPALTLMVITTIAALALSYTYYIAEPKILEQKEASMNLGLHDVMPEADEFIEREYYWSAYSGGELIGVVVIAKGSGYSGDIETMIGINKDNQITGIKILEQQETPGLGARIAEPEFTDRFTGIPLSTVDGIDGITGATISSEAVKESIKQRTAKIDGITGATP